MNIAKNHWVTFKCNVIDISLHLLVPVTFSFGNIPTAFYFNQTTVLNQQSTDLPWKGHKSPQKGHQSTSEG